MNVAPVNNIDTRKYYNYSKNAGYAALGTAGLCLIQGMRHKKSHRALGIISLIFASFHVGIIEYLHRKKDNTKSDKSI